ncbi:MAG TPA: phosphate signaling complex protein PhoU [Symbiobacteriaceae bacterium]|nr:phosphate signaling complex protein PhoU [Symbiobacteriaceae bacterium]
MRQTFHDQIQELQQRIIYMGNLVSEMIDQATLSLARKDSDLARKVIADDDEIDGLLIEVQMKSMQLLALQQPMARDLRRIGTGMKIVTDLERMADHATDIAEVTLRLEGEPLIKPLVDIPRMAGLAQQMTRHALDAYVGQNEKLAREMIAMDHDVDAIYSRMFDELLGFMERDPAVVKQATYLLHVAAYLERVADHATNIGEWTIYMLTGVLEELND